jgi:hypothetical protein
MPPAGCGAKQLVIVAATAGGRMGDAIGHEILSEARAFASKGTKGHARTGGAGKTVD